MNNTRIVEKYRLKKTIRNELQKLCITILLILIMLISIKKEPSLKERIKENVFTSDIISLKVKKIYQEYFSTKKEEPKSLEPVSKESLPYIKKVEEEDQVKLIFQTTTPIPILESGVLVYVDEEKGILEQIDGVRVTYSNIEIKNYKLYDYLEKGDILGETKELILFFQKEGETVDYKNYI